MTTVEEIRAAPNGEFETDLLAVVVRKGYDAPGVTFLSASEAALQVGYLRHPAGKVIAAHCHQPVLRCTSATNEVLLVRRGTLRADLYDVRRQYVTSTLLGAGDVLLLLSGGHGFEVIEEAEIIEVKNGPYLGAAKDKTVFPGVDAASARVS